MITLIDILATTLISSQVLFVILMMYINERDAEVSGGDE